MIAKTGAIAACLMISSATGMPTMACEPHASMTRAAAADVLKKGLEAAREPITPEDQVGVLRRAAEEVLQGRPENILASKALRGAMEGPAPEANKLAERLRSAIGEAAEILEFEVQEESPLPDGFPKPPPLGEIVVQSYPVYRAAKVDLNDGDNGAFMRLFGHIKSRGISMTTPVEMNYTRGEGGRPEKIAMSFLYRNSQQGTLGGDKVKVQDMGKLTAVSLGLRGFATEVQVGEAKERLEAWLADHAKEYRESGPIRTLIYNSPFMAAKKQFFEVQIPVESNGESK